MTHEFRLPDIGEGLTEAEIVRWLVPEGGRVEADQPVVEVETDKAVVEIPSPYAGTVLRHGAAEGETLSVGSVLVVIGDDAEMGAEPVAEADVAPAAPVEAGEAPPIVGTLSEEAESLTRPTQRAEAGGDTKVKALPIVRKLARELGVELSSVRGTGPEGRVTREDVLAAASAMEGALHPAEQEVAPEAVSQPQVSRDGDERRPMSRLRRTIAANMARSWAEIPHVTTFDEVDATRLLEVRQALAARHGVKVPIEALAIKAVIPALEQYPEFNATIEGDDVVLHHRLDLGIAVDTPEGLMVAVVREAGRRTLLEVAAEVERLGEGARNRTLGPDELTGQTFTVSNIGAVGGGLGTPIVPYGTTAILSVGRAEDGVIAVDGQPRVVPVMPLSLSYDHRLIDGAQGRRFMGLVIENLEEPALFLAG